MNNSPNVSPWNPQWFQDIKEQHKILNYKVLNDSLTIEERETWKYLSTVIDDINKLVDQLEQQKK